MDMRGLREKHAHRARNKGSHGAMPVERVQEVRAIIFECMNAQRFPTYIALTVVMAVLAIIAGAAFVSSRNLFIASIAGEGACFYILRLLRKNK